MDAWDRQRALARTTVAWSLLSLGVGVPLLRHRDPWWRGFAQQHVGWAVVDLGIVAVVQGVQRRTMRALENPYAPAELDRRRRHLGRVLSVNAVLDAGYCVTGAVMMHRLRDRPLAVGAGAAIVIQGGFLLLHDSWHARGCRRPAGEERASVG